jgi:AcrR family transcriptional regulator
LRIDHVEVTRTTDANLATADPRAALLESVIDAITTNGLGSRSLRDLARQAGTSHRMLIHHFGSRDGLLVAIVTEVEARQRALLQTRPDDSADAIATTWAALAQPALWPFERLFFECYSRGAQGEAPFDRLIPGLVDDWIAMFPRGRRRDQARLALAVIRGLLLDLVATEDRRGLDRAMKQFVELLRVTDS